VTDEIFWQCSKLEFEIILTFVNRPGTSGKTRRSSTATSLQQDPLNRRRLGSELSPSSTLRRVPTEHDEAVMLDDADLEDMASTLVVCYLSLLNFRFF